MSRRSIGDCEFQAASQSVLGREGIFAQFETTGRKKQGERGSAIGRKENLSFERSVMGRRYIV